MNKVFLLSWSNYFCGERTVSSYDKFFFSRESASVFAEQFFNENKQEIFDWSEEEILEAIADGDKPESFTWDKFIQITEMEKQQ